MVLGRYLPDCGGRIRTNDLRPGRCSIQLSYLHWQTHHSFPNRPQWLLLVNRKDPQTTPLRIFANPCGGWQFDLLVKMPALLDRQARGLFKPARIAAHPTGADCQVLRRFRLRIMRTNRARLHFHAHQIISASSALHLSTRRRSSPVIGQRELLSHP